MTSKSAVKTLVSVAVMAFCASFVQARPAVDASPDRVKYRLTPGVDGGSWLPTVPLMGW